MYSAQAELHARSGKKIAMCRKTSFLILESRFQNSVRDCRLSCPVCRCGSSIESPSSKASRPWKSIFAVDLCSGKAETIQFFKTSGDPHVSPFLRQNCGLHLYCFYSRDRDQILAWHLLFCTLNGQNPSQISVWFILISWTSFQLRWFDMI